MHIYYVHMHDILYTIDIFEYLVLTVQGKNYELYVVKLGILTVKYDMILLVI